MRQGLDIADVESRTKIRAKYLRALENEEFAMLPGSTFVKTFLRTYAEQLGLDPHLLLDEYRARHEPDDELEAAPLGPPAAAGAGRERERRIAPGPPGPGMAAGLVVAAVIALLLVLGLTGGEDDGDRAEQTATERTERAAQPPATEKAKPPPTSVTLEIEPSVPTYACIDTGEGTDVVFEGILEQGRSFKGKRVRLNLGKTSVRLTANGERVPLEPSPNPAGWEFTPSGSPKELPVGQRPCA